MKKIILLFISLLYIHSSFAKKTTREEYINKYSQWAVRDMKEFGIPASITLAQGLLESSNGNSRLAVEANNHFGIKCAEWTGKKIFKDDDHKNECFRVYSSVKDSYDDHANFLKNRDRYAFLFKYKPSDYKSWAHGLKKAGYATNPSYPYLLIKIIEENDLHRFDIDKKKANYTKHDKKVNNGVRYIIVQAGDTYESINEEFRLKKWELAYYNNTETNQTLIPNSILYLNEKRNKASKGYEKHSVRTGESIWSISQIYGIKLSKLIKYNRLSADYIPQVGDQIWLRKSKP